MKKLNKYNIIIGWAVFAIAAITYLLTLEPTASLWDCGEFIATSYKLQIGHPPGAPFFMITARFFSLFALGDVTKVAFMVNLMSGLASAFTVLFLFWSIFHLAVKTLNPNAEIKPWQYIAILGSAAIGALAYTFTDTFWFSAVEGEVYGSSSFYTAIVFWAILKWESVADEKYANRWLVLIAYLMGLSIGVHLLNLLTIPAIVLVYYFKKYKTSRRGLIIATFTSILILGGIFSVIIPGVLWLASRFELIFVNGFGFPFNSGLLFYAAVLIAAFILGIRYTQRNRKVLANTIILIVGVIILGYSSFTIIVIRSSAAPPLNENSPKTIFSLIYYLNRDQYGDNPLLYGQTFNARAVDMKEGKPIYTQRNGRYVITDHKQSYTFDSNYTMFFPRMWSNDNSHIDGYLDWAGIKESDLYQPLMNKDGQIVRDERGIMRYDRNRPKARPTFFENIRYLISYQLGFMYFRYFMWNFSGRQNDMQGYGSPLHGNWITGIPFLDNILIGGKESKMPVEMKNIPSRNKYYLLPFILGILGMLYHYARNKKDFWIVLVFFVMTGIAIVVYLNQKPLEPRERDYAYAGSFYAFAIWIGLGILGIIDMIGRRAQNIPTVICISSLSLILVPGIMAKENWHDHDRSSRYTTRDIAADYLNSCAQNAILFTNGDNDTFPLWYAQEVEGIRTDVRVVNLMLLNMDWYIDAMKKKAYTSDPLPISLKNDQYINGTRDVVYIQQQINQAFDAKLLIDFIASDDPKAKLSTQEGKMVNFLPTRKFFIPVDTIKVISNKTVKPQDATKIVNHLDGKIGGGYLSKSDLIVLDILANNHWDRPIYFAATGHSGMLGLEDYLQLDGLAYRLVPIVTKASASIEKGRIDPDILYDKYMNVYKYGGMNQPNVYMDNYQLRTLSVIRLRYRFARLANELTGQGDTIRAEKVLDRIVELTPDNNVPYDMFMPGIAESYFRLHKIEKGTYILDKLADIADRHLQYFMTFDRKKIIRIEDDISYQMKVLQNVVQIAHTFNQDDLAARYQKLFFDYDQKLSLIMK
jgi:hypothetical protein